MFWWTEASISCSNLSAVATNEHADSVSSPTWLQLMGGCEELRELGKYSPDTPRPVPPDDPGAGAASPGAALPETPALVLRATKSHSKFLASSQSRGATPTSLTLAVPYDVPPALGTSNTDIIIGRLGDATGRIVDRRMTETNEARLPSPQHRFLEPAQK
jgi:hypothetical protein